MACGGGSSAFKNLPKALSSISEEFYRALNCFGVYEAKLGFSQSSLRNEEMPRRRSRHEQRCLSQAHPEMCEASSLFTE